MKKKLPRSLRKGQRKRLFVAYGRRDEVPYVQLREALSRVGHEGVNPLLASVVSTVSKRSLRVLTWTKGEHGRPNLPGYGYQAWDANVSESEEFWAVAVVRGQRVGVDVEDARPPRDWDTIVSHFFSPRERAIYRHISPKHRFSWALSRWTMKEALTKLFGGSITRFAPRLTVAHKRWISLDQDTLPQLGRAFVRTISTDYGSRLCLSVAASCDFGRRSGRARKLKVVRVDAQQWLSVLDRLNTGLSLL